MAKGTGLVKSKARFLMLIEKYPERAEDYRAKIAHVESEIVRLQVCRRCGRPLKTEEARAAGYGKECQAQALAETEAHLSDTNSRTPTEEGASGKGLAGVDKRNVAPEANRDRSDWLRTIGEGHSSGVPGGEGLDEAVLR